MVRLNLQLFAYTGSSIVDYLKSVGQDSSYSARKKLAEQNGITNYSGTGDQNHQLLSILRGNTSNTSNTNTTNTTTSNTNTTTTNMKKNTNLSNVKVDGVDQSLIDVMTSEFQTSTAYQDAMSKIQGILAKIDSGKTSYTDQVKDLIGKIQNREEFSYDVDSDMLFQQYLSSMMQTGQTAMQDTIGQASALTGGYGSSYGTSAGNQAYNQYIQGAYDNLPEYYQMALQTYQMEGDEMYKQLSMLSEADAQEWARMMDDYTATNNYANTLWDQEYTAYSDMKNSASSLAGMQNSDYWNQKSYNQSQSQFIAANDLNGDGKVDSKDHEVSYQRSVTKNTKEEDTEITQKMYEEALKKYNEGGTNGLNAYLNSLPSKYDKAAKETLTRYCAEYGNNATAKDAWNNIKDWFTGLFD